MAPPTAPLNLDVEAISGICGSISIACWVVVFSPQILENFRRGSADGLSLQFIIVWLLGDVFNIWGAVLQGVLPTMIILAIYYTIADIVLLLQCFYYRGFTFRDDIVPASAKKSSAVPQLHAGEPDERTGLLATPLARERRGSDWSNLSPVVPLVSAQATDEQAALLPLSALQTAAWNTIAVLMVCTAGVAGWFLSRNSSSSDSDSSAPGQDDSDGLEFNFWGQVFGWLCAALYLGSRLPQLLLNWRRKSTEGVSMLFFLFACLGNLTYVLSIFAYDPKCEQPGDCEPGEAASIYGRYILVNASWLAGSAGTLLLDLGIFVQFFLYSQQEADEIGDLEDEEASIDEERWERPLLQRGDSAYG